MVEQFSELFFLKKHISIISLTVYDARHNEKSGNLLYSK